MAAIAVLPDKRRRVSALTLVWLAIGLGLLAASATALYFSRQNDALAAYNSAPPCPTFADAAAGKDCRYTTIARVTQSGGYDGTDEVYFEIPGQYSPVFKATLPLSDAQWMAGQEVPVELWRLRATRFGGLQTFDNPALDRRPGVLLTIGVLLLPFGLGAIGAGMVTMRRRSRAMATPTMSPVAMSDVLWR